MRIERTDKEIIIRLPLGLDVNDIQKMIDYLSYKSAVQESQASDDEIASLANEVKKGWWNNNQHRFPDLLSGSV